MAKQRTALIIGITGYVADNMPANMRPADVQYLRGDYSKAKRVLGWKPKVEFEELVDIMVRHELRAYE